MTPDELIEKLAPIRIPVSFAEFTLRDALLAVALGIVMGLVLAKLIALATTRKVKTGDRIRAEIARLATGAEDTRLTGLAALLKEYDPQAAGRLGLADALYNPAQTADPAQIEQAILDATRSIK